MKILITPKPQDSSALVLLKGGWDGTGPEDWTAEAPWMIFR